MTEQQLREKIIKALKRGGNMFHEYFMRSLNGAKESGKTRFGSKDCDKSMYDFFADALIEDGIGDMSEWKHRAEVAEKIAEEACGIVFCEAIDNEEWDEVIRNYKETKEKYSDEFGITDEMLYDYLHEKAEKELQEERKDE